MKDVKDNLNPDIIGENRDKQGRFVSGISGNPFGRPKNSFSIRDKIRQKLGETPDGEKETYLELITKKILAKAIKGEFQTIRLIWEQIDGRARESVKLSQSGTISLASLLNEVEELEDE